MALEVTELARCPLPSSVGHVTLLGSVVVLETVDVAA